MFFIAVFCRSGGQTPVIGKIDGDYQFDNRKNNVNLVVARDRSIELRRLVRIHHERQISRLLSDSSGFRC